MDYPAVGARAKSIRDESRQSLRQSVEELGGVTRLRGHARLAGRDGKALRVRVGDETVLSAQVVLSTGTRSAVPPIEGIGVVDAMDAENWLERPELPGHLLIVGGSYIGRIGRDGRRARRPGRRRGHAGAARGRGRCVSPVGQS